MTPLREVARNSITPKYVEPGDIMTVELVETDAAGIETRTRVCSHTIAAPFVANEVAIFELRDEWAGFRSGLVAVVGARA